MNIFSHCSPPDGKWKKWILSQLPAAQPTAEPNPVPEVLWNLEKFLVSRHGTVVKRFAPDATPEDPALVGAVETELGRH